MSDRETVAVLAGFPLFEGWERADLVELARAVRRRTVRRGEVLWRQGDEAREMVFIVEGAVGASLRVAGGGAVAIGHAGPGEMIGEISLIDGGTHTMSVAVTQAATVLVLGQRDFATLLNRQYPTAFSLKRRLAELFTGRLRNQLRHLGGPPPLAAEATPADLEYCRPPDSAYIRRMASFHEFDRLAVWGFLTSGRYAQCPPGRTLLLEGAPSSACYLTINGAVEKVMTRGERRIRVGLAGPGKAFGYEGLIDGGPSPVTAVTRERALLLALPRESFVQLFNAEDAISRVVLDVILRDLVSTLRQTLSPLARKAYSPPG